MELDCIYHINFLYCTKISVIYRQPYKNINNLIKLEIDSNIGLYVDFNREINNALYKLEKEYELLIK